jgi:hypothetical protein
MQQQALDDPALETLWIGECERNRQPDFIRGNEAAA